VERGSRHRGLAVVIALAASMLLVACGGSEGSSDGGASASWTKLDPAGSDKLTAEPGMFFVKVHVPHEGEIPFTDAFIPYDQIASRLAELPSDPTKLAIYCRSGNMSSEAAQALVAQGYSGFYELGGGYDAWVAEGHDFVVRPTASPAG
jgi:rhodanese-related sulfurtransferase